MHDEVFEAAHDAAALARDTAGSTASSPSEAYANMTLESREPTMPPDADQTPTRPPPRSASPAKRPHSDVDGGAKEQADTPPGSARSVKPLPASPRQRSTTVEMVDAPAPPAQPIPSLDDQVLKVMALHDRPLSDGQEGFVISEQWLERVFSRTSENKNKPGQFSKTATVGPIGPVDCSNLIDTSLRYDDLVTQTGESFVPLRPGLAIGHDFEILPTEAWELIISWYGLKNGSPVIRRYAHNTALDQFSENLQYEVYPPIFTIRKVRQTGMSPQTLKENSNRSPKLVASRSNSYVEFLKAAKTAAGLDLKTKARVWRVLTTAPTDQAAPQPPSSGMMTPASSPRNGSPVSPTRDNALPLLIDVANFTSLAEGTERELVTVKDETANENYNGHATLHVVGLGEDQVLIFEEQDEHGEYISESTKKAAQTNGVPLGNSKIVSKANKGIQSNTTSGRNSPVSSGPTSRGRTRSGGRTRGTVGLSNLGNTCYMNSALQCIRSVEELSCYFITDSFKSDLNTNNPLGHGGSIAKQYAGLASAIYSMTGAPTFSPKSFKQALGRAQPLFSGYGQQDSQEFLSFLVDGLHEDLNRVKKKPYTENPESDDNTFRDPAAIIALGEKFRAIHRSRNDSVAMDLFNGFYKNTMVCPSCEKVSITFDPYSLLTLQLPIEQTWQHTITFVPLRRPMVNIDVDIDKNATIKSLKEYIAKRFDGVSWKRIIGTEVYTNKFYRVLEDDKSIVECNVGVRDVLFFYELEDVPTNWPPPKKKKKQQYKTSHFPVASSEEDLPKSSASPLGDKMLVPIFHRGPSMSTYRGHSWNLVLWPSYIVLTREEAKDYDTILKKILGKVAQMTTRPILTEHSGTSHSPSRTGSDIVLTTEEDASPDGDPRVHDGSVEGEDNMVEVTMGEPVETATGQSLEEETPEVLRPGTFIPRDLEELFEIKHTHAGKEMVPLGWSGGSVIDASKEYDSILDRRPVSLDSSRQSSVRSSGADRNSNASSSEDIDDVPQPSADAQSSVDHALPSSEDEMPSIEHESSRGGRHNGKHGKHGKHGKRFNKTLSKKEQRMEQKNKSKKEKGKDRITEQPMQSSSDLEGDDNDGLIRLGESIVLDWTEDTYNALFGGNPKDYRDQRGIETNKIVPTLEDEELQKKKAQRAARKKNGITLEECFAETSKSEVLSEDNAWYCSKCKELRRAEKTLEIWTTPDILVIHLKRFSAHRTFRDKIEAFVDCPLEGLDLSGKVGLPEDKSQIYDLFAVDNHFGGLGGGHYTACARNFFDGKWYDYNDSSVSPRQPDQVVTKAAYLLFYRRRSERALGPAYLQEITEKFRNPGSNSKAVDDSDEDNARTSSRSPAGNGSRLGDLSRNGSSSALGVGAGALRGGGSISAGNLQERGVAVGTADDDSEMLDDTLPAYGQIDDEGYDDGNSGGEYGQLGLPSSYTMQGGDWSFASIENRNTGDDEDSLGNMDSRAGEDLSSRMNEDFPDEMGEGILPGMSTPLEDEVPPLLGAEDDDDDEVALVLLDDEA